MRNHIFEAHGDGYACEGHCEKHFRKKKFLRDHLARVKAKQEKVSMQMYSPEAFDSVKNEERNEFIKEHTVAVKGRLKKQIINQI